MPRDVDGGERKRPRAAAVFFLRPMVVFAKKDLGCFGETSGGRDDEIYIQRHPG